MAEKIEVVFDNEYNQIAIFYIMGTTVREVHWRYLSDEEFDKMLELFDKYTKCAETKRYERDRWHFSFIDKDCITQFESAVNKMYGLIC